MVKTYLSTLWIFEAPTKNPRLPKQKQRQESFSTQVMSTCRTSFPRGVGIMDVPFSSSPSLVSSISGTQTTRSKRVRVSCSWQIFMMDDDHLMMITWWWSLRKNTDDVEDDDHDDNWMFLQDVKHLLNRPSNLQSQMNSSRTSKAKLETTFKDATLSTLYWLVPFDRGWYNHPLYRRKDIFLVHHIFIQHKKVGVYQGKLSPNNYLLEIQMLNMSP